MSRGLLVFFYSSHPFLSRELQDQILCIYDYIDFVQKWSFYYDVVGQNHIYHHKGLLKSKAFRVSVNYDWDFQDTLF